MLNCLYIQIIAVKSEFNILKLWRIPPCEGPPPPNKPYTTEEIVLHGYTKPKTSSSVAGKSRRTNSILTQERNNEASRISSSSQEVYQKLSRFYRWKIWFILMVLILMYTLFWCFSDMCILSNRLDKHHMYCVQSQQIKNKDHSIIPLYNLGDSFWIWFIMPTSVWTKDTFNITAIVTPLHSIIIIFHFTWQ